MKARSTKEAQYQPCLDLRDTQGLTPLGLMTNQVWHDDPRRLGFVLARYKFVAKMLAGYARILEIGCADAFGTRVVLQTGAEITAVDFDPVFVDDARARMDPRWPFEVRLHDITAGPVAGTFDAAYLLDVIEHISPDAEGRLLDHITASLGPHGVLLIGTPSIESQVHASPQSRDGHVNCKDAEGLRQLGRRYFHHVFMFSMNDEVVHTGFFPMAQYLFALCCDRIVP